MRNTVRLTAFFALAAFAASLTAQQRAQDFTLPEPTPTGTPQPQGPVDDSGIIPVGPRVIPTSTPTPIPTTVPSPVPTQAPVTAPTTQTAPQPAASATLPRPVATPIASPPPSPVATVPAPQTAMPESDPVDLPALPSTVESETDSSLPVQTEVQEEKSSSLVNDVPWSYVLGGLLGLLAVLGGFFLWKRRKENAPPPPIKRPVVDAALDQVGASAIPPRFDVAFEVQGINRSLMAVMVSGHIVIKNRGERAIRDIGISAELTSAHHPSAKSDGNLQKLEGVDRVGPHQTQREKVSLKLPLDQIQGIRREGVPFFVPLVRLEVAAEGAEAKRLDIVLGSVPPGGNTKLQPLRLDGPPGAYDHLRGHPLTA